HEQAAARAYLVALDLRLVLEAREQLGIPRLVFGSPDGESFAQALPPREPFGVAAEQDVDAAPGHVRGHRDARQLAGLGDDLGLPRVLLRVEDLVRNAPLLEQARQL